MNQHSKVFEDFIHFTNLLLNILDGLFSLLYDCLIEDDLVVQQKHLLSADPKCFEVLNVWLNRRWNEPQASYKKLAPNK